MSKKQVMSGCTILFIADTSGSMYGGEIASVNASINECVKALKALDYEGIKVRYARFDEKFRWETEACDVTKSGLFRYEIKPNEDGFFRMTDISQLYRGLYDYLEQRQEQDKKCVVLMTDGKVMESGAAQRAFELLNSLDEFQEVERYVAITKKQENVLPNEFLKFVDFKANHIIHLEELPAVLSYLNIFMTKDGMKNNYNDVFDESIFN